jgi:signal transduction histidine kinase
MSAADTAHLFLYDGEKLTFGCASWAEGHPKEIHDKPHPNGLTYQVARSGKPMIVTDARTHPVFADHAWDGAVVGMPIYTGSRVLGVMNLAYHGRPHEFDEHELRALAMLADQAAIAMINANLYTEAQDRAHQLAEALLQREELDRMKNEFIQNVSHELRTPLAIIHGYSDLLKTGELGPLNADQLDAVNTLSRRIQFLTKLVDDLVVILEAEGRDMARELVPLNEIILGSVHDFQAEALEAGLELNAELPEDIILIEGNYTHLNRLMDNLVGNAIKFTPPEGSVTVILECSETEGIIRVTDTGIGISPDKIDHIFERFYQVDGSTKRRFGGIGLGLALVKEIVKAHGGKITVDSQVGKGSTFTVRLPLPD